MARSREEIRSEIEYRVSGDTRLIGSLNGSNVKVEVSEGRVVLSGVVHSFSAREALEQDAWAVRGVNFVENRLNVKFPDGYKRPGDQAIRENLQTLFSLDPDLYQENISIFINDGKVSLEGTVGFLFMKLRAGHLAHQIGGIDEVSNKLAVVPTRTASDSIIGSAIEDHLHRTLGLDANQVVIEVENGRVMLSGQVPDRRGFDTVEDIARYTDGVTSVENRMAISAG